MGLATLVGATRSARAEIVDLWADIGFYTGDFGDSDFSVTAIAPSAGLRLHLGPVLGEGRLGFVTISPEEGDGATRLENPWLAGYMAGSAGPLSYRYGVGLALPLSGADDAIDQAALGIGGALDGFWNFWLFAPEQLGIAVPVHVEFAVPVVLTVIGEAGFGILIDTGDYAEGTEDDGLDAGLQLAGEVRIDAIPVVKPGLRLQTVIALTAEDVDDASQSSIVPYLRAAFGPAWAQLGIVLNVDDPFGFSSDFSVWGLHLSGGATI